MIDLFRPFAEEQPQPRMYPVDLLAASRDLPAATMDQLAQEFAETVAAKNNVSHEHIKVPQGWKGDAAILSTTFPMEQVGDE